MLLSKLFNSIMKKIPKIKSVFRLFLSAVIVVYGFSFLINQIFGFHKKWTATYCSFDQLFLFFASLSTVLLVIHYLVSKKNKDQLGFVFLVTVTLKVAACYIFINQIEFDFEKHYAFAYFFIFLLIDVLITVQLLNKKE